MIISITNDNYKMVWLKLIINNKLQIELTNKQYQILEQITKYDRISLMERKNIAYNLRCSHQVVTNNIKKLKDYKLLEYVKELDERNISSYYYKLSIKLPPTLESLLSRKENIEFQLKN